MWKKNLDFKVELKKITTYEHDVEEKKKRRTFIFFCFSQESNLEPSVSTMLDRNHNR